MIRAHKTARISSGGYYPPHALDAPVEPQEGEPQEQEDTPPVLVQAPAPPQEEPEHEEDPEIIEIEDDDDEDAVTPRCYTSTSIANHTHDTSLHS
jgi:hypothetical protein